MSLFDLVEQSKTVTLSGGSVEVYPLDLRKILTLIGKHSDIASSLQFSPKEARADVIREAVISAGSDAVSSLIDAATKSESGAAEKAPLSAMDQLEIVEVVVDMSLPKERLGKFMVKGEQWLAALGLES